jgi:hypothetical protein
MRAHDEARLGIGGLVVLQLLTAGAAIGLLSQVGAAISLAMRESVYSEAAASEMLYVVAGGEPADAAERTLFLGALDRARRNITVDDERPAIEGLTQVAPGALAGDPTDRAMAAALALELGEVNRRSMAAHESRARSLGWGGAWAAAIFGGVGFALALVVWRRFQLRFLAPLEELDAVLSAALRGDLRRRARITDAPAELMRAKAGLNDLLDRGAATPALPDPAAVDLLGPLLELLDRQAHPVWLFSGEGMLVAANQAGLLFEGDRPGWNGRRPGAETLPPPYTASACAGGAWLVELIPSAAPPSAGD